MPPRNEEERLRRAIAAGAGELEVEALLRLLQARRPQTDPHEATVEIPRCWRRLIKTRFPTGLEGRIPTSQAYAPGDPKPRRDDSREIVGGFPDGQDFEISLASGNDGYWGMLTLPDDQGQPLVEHDLDPSDLDDEAICVTLHGRRRGDETEYTVKIKWIPDDEPFLLAKVRHLDRYGTDELTTWIPWDLEFDPPQSPTEPVLRERFERLTGLSGDLVIAVDADQLYVDTIHGNHIPYDAPT